MMGKPTHEQIAKLAYAIWQYTVGTRSAERNWLEAEYFYSHGVISVDDPDPIMTLIPSQIGI